MSSAVGSSNQSLALGRNKNRKRKRKTRTAPNRRCSTSKTFLGYLFLLDERSNIASLGPDVKIHTTPTYDYNVAFNLHDGRWERQSANSAVHVMPNNGRRSEDQSANSSVDVPRTVPLPLI